MRRRTREACIAAIGALVGFAARAGVWVQGDATPRPRVECAMAYDSTRARTVLHGGTDNLRYFDDAWEYDGATWRRLPAPPAALGARYGHAMVYDAARGRIVLFGGADAMGYKNDTWEYDGSSWSPGAAASAGLTPRGRFAMAYDLARSRAVLFGGYDGAYRNDTWEYDGAAWTSGPGPPGGLVERDGAVMVYDASRSRTVLFGGVNAGGILKDTWEYDGAAWTAGAPAPPALTARYAAAMSFDAARSRIVLFGGWDGSNTLKDTWEYDGATWSFTGNGPAPMWDRLGHRMAFDTKRARTVLFGGASLSTPGWSQLKDTWEHDGAGWSPGGGTPAQLYPRFAHALAHDAARDDTILYGGEESISYDDTWKFDGSRWSPGPAPPPGLSWRSHHAMAYDESRSRVVLFGGSGPGGLEKDSWEFDGTAWLAGPAAPSALHRREDHAMVYDASRSLVVLFGGYGALGSYNDTWEYDGSAWTAGPAAPPLLFPRRDHAMAYDAGRQLTVLFGGQSTQGYKNDTWECDGSSWTQGPAAPAGLSARFNHAMAFDPSLSRIVLFGGEDLYGPFNDTWEYDGTTWTMQAPAPADLTPRSEHAMTYDATLGSVILFGGKEGGQFSLPTSDTWLYVACPSLALSPATLLDARAGAAYSQPLTASGGTSPYTFAVTSGSLPAGLTLSSGGLLSGTPLASGTAAFTVTATDSIGCNGSQPYTLSVLNRLDYLVGQGLGAPNPNRCRVYTAVGSGPSIDFYAYGARYGLNVAAGNVNGGTDDEILTGPGSGDVFGPQVRAFRRDSTAIAKINFYAYGTLRFGVNVAAGSIDADAFAEILTGPGPGAVFGPHVRAFNFDGVAVTPIAKVSFFAYGTLKYGVNAGDGDVDGDGFAEILTGPGPGAVFGPVVRAFNFDGATVTSIAKINFSAFGTPQYGALVAGGDVDADGFGEIAASPGPGPALPAEFRGFNFDAMSIGSLPGYGVTGFPGAVAGGRVLLGDLDGDGRADLVGGAGPDAANDSTVKTWSYDGTALTPSPVTFVAFPSTAYGVNVAAGGFDY